MMGSLEFVDSTLARQTADEARERPEVRRWIRRLGKLIKDMPPGLEVFVGDSVTVLATGPNGASFMTSTECADPSAAVESFTDSRWDGGGW